ncbi:hypothetical protein GCM10020258_56790 [Sphingomonas yabuuchiae]
MFDGNVPKSYRDQIAHELRLIGELGYAPYFLTVHSIVREARRRGILCQGRGSAANSCVCFVLGVTSIDPIKHELLFERFVSGERREPPISTSILSMNGARRSSSGSTKPMGVTGQR